MIFEEGVKTTQNGTKDADYGLDTLKPYLNSSIFKTSNNWTYQYKFCASLILIVGG